MKDALERNASCVLEALIYPSLLEYQNYGKKQPWNQSTRTRICQRYSVCGIKLIKLGLLDTG